MTLGLAGTVKPYIITIKPSKHPVEKQALASTRLHPEVYSNPTPSPKIQP